LNRIIDLRSDSSSDRAITHPHLEDRHVGRQGPDAHAMAFITCVNDQVQYQTCVRYIDGLQIPPGHTVEKIAVLGAKSMAEGYQQAIEASTARYKIYVHQDVYLVHRGLLSELLNLFGTYPRLGMVGVIGTTQLPTTGIWWVDNASYSYGRVWVYVTLAKMLRGISLAPSAHQRRLRFMRLQSFVGDYIPAVAVDGLLMATQYDVPWVDPVGGFMLYDQVQSLEFIKVGLEVGIARQEAVWCLHWGPLEERSREQRQPYDTELDRRAAVFRQRYHAYIGVPARILYKKHWNVG
jgi:hypothetical protein